MLKNILKFTIASVLAFGFNACNDSKEVKETKVEKKDIVIKIGATPVPHAEILEAVKPILKAKGYDLQIVEFTDYVTPNIAVNEGELDANFFQHLPYLEEFNKNKNTELVKTVNVHLEPMGLYSHKIKALSELADSATIAVPNDPTNESRALDLLAKQGLLTLQTKLNSLIASQAEVDAGTNDTKFVTPLKLQTKIATALSSVHTHTNKSYLDKIGETTTGEMTYNGDAVYTLGSSAW